MSSTEQPKPRERSLARRVGWTAALAAVVASLLTLVVAMVVVDLRVIHDAEERLRDRAAGLVHELDENEEGVSRAQLANEVDEFSDRMLSVAVYDESGRLAGNATLPPMADDGCAEASADGEDWLVCRASMTSRHYWVVTGEPRAKVLQHRRPLIAGGLIALLVMALGGVAAGLAVGQWSLKPLTTIRNALNEIDFAAAAAPRLPRSKLAEIDAVTRAVERTFLRLEEELNRSRQFSADAAHELRTPLTKLRTELELLAEDLPAGTPRDALDKAVARVEDLALLVDRLLLLGTPGATLRGASLVSLSGVAESVVAALDLEGERVQLELVGDGLVVGDEAVLSAVVSNAVGNALKFSAGVVTLQIGDEGECVVVRVGDEGRGLSDEERARAFEGFYRAPRHRTTSGHGIGLALIRHIVEAHGGVARFAERDRGALLEVELPRHRVSSD